ncbi:DUF4145 domain-containing protein [Bordetella bronchiseptica]|uniref:DUF4145 domain-containing protein n=1 Tax=Bordetella bronchiseptica TaxID=518 RepID=UPI001F2B50FD|nr:DUF4145 domain-containing protein [Bordetella bronchiseptica]
MATLIMNCPHCPARHAMFDLKGTINHPQKAHVFISVATCGNCGDGVLIHSGDRGTGIVPNNVPGDLLRNKQHVQIFRIDPTREKASAPEAVPEATAMAFQEGYECWQDGRYSSAVAMFRRSLEIALKQFSPDIEAWKLEKRIDKLASLHLITQDMKDWAHEIRLVGNEALHEEDVPSKKEAEDLMMFSEMLLTYLYTLPAKVRARRNEDGAA